MNENNTIYNKVFLWMFTGLLITFLTGYSLSLNINLMYHLMEVGLIPILLIELGIAIFFGFRIAKMHPMTAKICFLIYSFTTGLTFSTIFAVFEMNSIMMVFGITSLLFLIFALYGYFTKRDITKIGSILFMMLLGIIITSLVNVIFIRSTGLDLGISIITIIVFLGYIAFDMKKIKYLIGQLGDDKGAIYGAFQLYLDFINIFIRLLRILGKAKD